MYIFLFRDCITSFCGSTRFNYSGFYGSGGKGSEGSEEKKKKRKGKRKRERKEKRGVGKGERKEEGGKVWVVQIPPFYSNLLAKI